MKSNELISYWGSPDNSRLTAKQYSLRLPIHVAAKISALCDLYPNKNRTQIVGDLLATALEDVEDALPTERGEEIDVDERNEPIYEVVGPAVRFRNLAQKYQQELEAEIDGGSS